ncbi:MAG: tRNA (adenosine(37)-N6)-threonylcarbamoyltransferase complex ATPase subunit type 1 TsaE [Alphaproteobacteria bacterium]|nr:tRNA (adenosine(37)-N6)-threonylcarbamoyltransferase complex ATPase subunit type 1 TsaE [Alphaproteobacteria bacterium]
MDAVILLPDLSATQAFAQRIAPLVKAQDVLLLVGDLGAGKTAFARCLLQALGVQGEVPSPTFTLVQMYDGRDFPLYHFDLYRLKHPDEIEEIGFDEACAEGAVLVEWPEKAAHHMPSERLTLTFQLDPNGKRSVILSPTLSWISRIKESI